MKQKKSPAAARPPESIAQLEGDWPDQGDDLPGRCARARRVPLNEIGVEDLAQLLRQDVDTHLTAPIALDILWQDPLVGDYAGALLWSFLCATRPPELDDDVLAVCQRARRALLQSGEQEEGDFFARFPDRTPWRGPPPAPCWMGSTVEVRFAGAPLNDPQLEVTTASPLVLGRGDGPADLLLDDPRVATRHAFLSLRPSGDEGRLWLTCAGTPDGVIVNGERHVDGPIANTDLIRIGPFEFHLWSDERLGRVVAEGHRLTYTFPPGHSFDVFGTERTDIVVKYVRSEERDARDTALRTLHAMQSFSHPQVARIHHVGVDDEGGVFFVSSALPGHPLDVDRPHGVPETARIGVQLCDIVGAAHDAGLPHLALGPAKVHVVPAEGDRAAKVHVRDFGYSCRPRARAVWIAPEAHGDERADVWSIAMLLYLYASGERDLRNHPPRVPELLDDVLGPALATDPAERCTLAELRAGLAALVDKDGQQQRR